ncbi:hsr203J family protein [Salix suchowensis]|nr:hsr203J family protein [Salix suchowensis]
MVYQRKLVEEVSGWLRIFDDGWVDRTWTGPPEVKFMSEPVPPHEEFIEGVATRDVGSSNSVSVYLRLAPEHRLPAAIDDGFSALMWLRALARGDDSYEPWLSNHGDFNRVFLIGDSSGANLVHHVAARAGQVDLSPVRLAGGIPVHPGFVRSERSKSEMEQPESPFLTLDMVDRFLKLALPKGCSKDHPFTCPMGPAAPPLDNLNLPPFLLCVAETDLIRDTEMEYYEAMKKADKDVELLINPGVGHSFYLNKIAVDMDPNTAAQTTALLEGIVEFIKKH